MPRFYLDNSRNHWDSLLLLIIALIVNSAIAWSIYCTAKLPELPDQAKLDLTPFVLYQPETPPEEELPVEIELESFEPISMPEQVQPILTADVSGVELAVALTIDPSRLVGKFSDLRWVSMNTEQPIQQSIASILQGIPLVRIPPTYPPAAQARGIEGQVIVKYKLSVNGEPLDIEIIEESPKGYFRQATLQAIRRWRFQVDPQLPMTTLYQTTIKYELSKS